MQPAIKSVKYFSCGYCTNNLGRVFRGMRGEKRKFPAGAFLIEHAKHGLILFDTGYSVDICKTGFVGRAYNFFNPTSVEENDELKFQLSKIGTRPEDIKIIILSHLHPDHIGGLRSFGKANFIVSKETINTYKNRRIRDLIMQHFFPADFEDRANVISDKMMVTEVFGALKGYDLFNDGSLILLKLGGHASGQLGALIDNKILLAADSCWGNDLIDLSYHMKFPASLIQDNMREYRNTLDNLKLLKKKGVNLVFSHDANNKKELL